MNLEQILGNLFDKLWFEDLIVLAAVMFLWWMVYAAWYFYNFITKEKLVEQLITAKSDKKLSDLLKQVKSVLHKIVLIIQPSTLKFAILTVVSFVVVGSIAYFYFFTRPYVVYQYPPADQPYTNMGEPITIVFNKPVKPDELEFNISSNTTGRFEWIPSFSNLPGFLDTYREVRFYPQQTMLPDENFVVYLVGIESLTGAGGIHEHNLDFAGPETPDIEVTSIENFAEDIQVTDTLEISFDAPNNEAVDWEFEIDPPVEFEIISVSEELWEIQFAEELDQDTTYNVTAARKVVQKDLSTGTVISEFDPKTVLDLKFTTTAPPSLERIAPTGSSVLPDKQLVIEFEDELNQQSVEQALQITPAIEGTVEWKDTKKLIFTPINNWELNTKYSISLAAGLESVSGGFTEKEITHSFTTIGNVKVLKFSPKSGDSGVSISERLLTYFDQPVNTKSAENKFSISPNINGSFKWQNDRRLEFVPNGSLAYNTTYTITINSGVKSQQGKNSTKSFSTQFTTQPEVFILNVPWYSQQERFTCNVASTRMALAYRGIYKSELDIKSGLGIGTSLNGSSGGDPYTDWIDGYGTYWTNVSDYVSNYRNTQVHRNWTITELLTEVSNGNPSILWWQNGWSDWYTKSWSTSEGKEITGLNGMHSEVAIGYKGSVSNPSQIITRDPWRGTRYYDTAYFEQLWTNSFSRTAVTVY